MTNVLAFYNNERRADPTRTLTLRERWVTDWNVRIAALKKVIKKSVVDNDGFGIKQENRFLQIQAAPPLTPATTGQWAYRWSHEKVVGFMSWLREMEERSLLEIVQRDVLRPGGEPWSNIHVRSAYQRGLAYALDNIRERSENLARNLGLLDEDLPPAFRSTGGAISALMNQPFHADRLALAYTRVFDELKGVTATMDQQISRVLAEGLAQGLNPQQIGDKIADRVEKIGGTRGRLIARTEVINVHQQAALNEYYATENATGEVVLIEWNATMDARTRDTHAERHERVYTKEEAYALIGEPNCRCALLPYIPAVQGMPKKATQAAKEAARKAIEKSELEEKKSKEKEKVQKEGKLKPVFAPPSEKMYSKKIPKGFDSAMEYIEKLQSQLGISRNKYSLAMTEMEAALMDQVPNKYVLTDPSGSLIRGAYSFTEVPSEKIITILNLGSTGEVKGTGTEIIRRILEQAAKKELGVAFESTPEAMGFYQKLGFKNNLPGLPSKIFKSTYEEVKRILASLGKSGRQK